MPITVGGYGQFYGNAGGGEVGAMLYRAQRSQVDFARYVEIEKLNMQKRALREQEATAAARRKDSDRNYDLAQSRLAMEQQRLDFNDALRQDQKNAAEERYRQALLQKEQARQDALQRQQAEMELKRQQMEAQNQRQQSLDNYRNARLDLAKQKQEAAQAGKSATEGRTAKVSASGYESILNNYISGLEATKKDKDGWIEREAKKARSLANDDEDMATRAMNLERWGVMNENQRYGTGLYEEVSKNTWTDGEGKVLEFAKRFRDFAKANPEIYTRYGFQPMFDQVDWTKVGEEEREAIFKLMRPNATKDEVALVFTLLGGLPLTDR